MNRDAVNHIITAFGGVAEMCDMITEAGWVLKAGSVYKWRNTGRIPELWGTRLIVTAESNDIELDRATLFEAFGSNPEQEDAA